MARTDHKLKDIDSLRLLGLGRIPRCAGCPRFMALSAVHARNEDTRNPGSTLPAVPAGCNFQFCAALVPNEGTSLSAFHAA